MTSELKDVGQGLWVWRLAHPDWKPGQGWEPIVTSTVVESRGEVILIDPLSPPNDAAEIWERLDARPPTVVAILKPDHVRDVDAFVCRYDARAYGPSLFWRDDVPQTELEPVEPGTTAGRAGRALRRARPKRDAAMAARAARWCSKANGAATAARSRSLLPV